MGRLDRRRTARSGAEGLAQGAQHVAGAAADVGDAARGPAHLAQEGEGGGGLVRGVFVVPAGVGVGVAAVEVAGVHPAPGGAALGVGPLREVSLRRAGRVCVDKPMSQRMFFVVGAPRSGTTLLMRMLNVHPEIYTRPEPHLLTPLAHLGYYAYVDKAPYDQLQAAQSVKEFVGALEGGEETYLEALRAYTDQMYGKMLEPTGKRFFLDKTPAYGLILPFLEKLYPDAVFIILTRHPFAIFSSFAESFFDDDWEVAWTHNKIVERYVPALASFVRNHTCKRFHHVRYEDLVADPEKELRAICAAADMPYTPDMINYGQKQLDATGLGDPIGVGKDTKPNTKSLHKWARSVAHNERRMEMCREMVRYVDDADLELIGYTRDGLWAPLADVSPEKAKEAQNKAVQWDRYHVERRLLVWLRRDIHTSVLGKLLKKLRFYTDVLLRE
jgi:hypothetical protein